MVVYVDGETPLQYSYDEGEGVLATRYSDTEVIVCVKKEIKE
jgi:hypothetical protein